MKKDNLTATQDTPRTHPKYKDRQMQDDKTTSSEHTGLSALLLPSAAPGDRPWIDQIPQNTLARIEVMFFDCDGVMTDGRVWTDAEGKERKAFSVIDGHGMAMLRESGVRLGMITRSPKGISTARATKLHFDILKTSVLDKSACLRKTMEELGLAPHQCGFMGDDLPDLGAFEHVHLKIAPSSARPQVLHKASAHTRAKAGHGAVREVCDAIALAKLQKHP